MRRAARGLLSFLPAIAVLIALPALAVRGNVTEVDGKPVYDARVCQFQELTKTEMLCVTTDRRGNFALQDSDVMALRVSAPGYFPEVVPAKGFYQVVLKRSPTLTVRLVDASTGKPIEKSEVLVIYPSAKQKGPFPANRAGVRIARVLDPGDVRLVGSAAGYASNEPFALTLVAGEEAEATLELSPRPD